MTVLLLGNDFWSDMDNKMDEEVKVNEATFIMDAVSVNMKNPCMDDFAFLIRASLYLEPNFLLALRELAKLTSRKGQRSI